MKNPLLSPQLPSSSGTDALSISVSRFSTAIMRKCLSSRGYGSMLRMVCASVLSLAGAASALSSQVTWLTVDPKLQLAYVDVAADLGFPIGQKSLIVTVDCPRSQVMAFEDSGTKMPIDPARWKPDTAIFKALQSSGVLLQKGGTTTLVNPKTKERLGLVCTGGVLSIDYSGMNALGSELSAYAPLSRNAATSEIDMNYDLSLHTNTKLSNYAVQVEVQPRAGGLAITLLRVIPAMFNWAAKAQVFFSDGQSLYPIYYSGQTQANNSLSTLILKNQVQFYSSDDPAKGGWRKTTYDYKTQVLTTVPVPKPTLPIRQ